MTPQQIASQIQYAELLVAQGDLASALSLYKVVLDANRGDEKIFRMYRGLYSAVHGHDLSHAAVFDFIYASQAWISGSGLGSQPQTTETYRRYLRDFLANRSIRSVVDAGCGDWQFSRLIDWSGVDYLGIDVSSVVIKNIACHAARNIRFVEGDIRALELPGADLLIVKDVLQHWSNADIHALSPKFARYRYCLITNGSSPDILPNLNKDMRAGGWRPVDLALPPFSVAGEYVLDYDVSHEFNDGRHVTERKRVFLIQQVVA